MFQIKYIFCASTSMFEIYIYIHVIIYEAIVYCYKNMTSIKIYLKYMYSICMIVDT